MLAIEIAIFTKIGLGWVCIHFWWVLICTDVLFQFFEDFIFFILENNEFFHPLSLNKLFLQADQFK